MAQTRMFRDRVVSMEQTLEGGEKHLPLLKELCREAFPELEYREHVLDHERDLFVMELESPAGQRARIAWTRMVLFDAERIPTLTGDPAAALRRKIVDFLKSRAGRPEIVVTFRHLEEGWIDTPEPRREGGRRRRRGRGGRGGGAPDRRPQGTQAQAGRGPQPQQPRGPMPPRPADIRPPQPQARAAGEASGAPGQPGAPGAGTGRRRRRFRRRGRGRGPSGSAGPAPAGGPGPAGPKP
jgi:hypothetical protein